ncbi:MAG: toxin-antitoxin system HicB family antitoxin [Coriobacteriales bacterium]|nr:toxin-antitoxin system HicB family antitoxin [Coriobacteriales bacterium]
MESNGEQIPIPFSERTYSGHISLRITPEQHRRLAIESAEQGVSINQLLVSRV